MWKTFVANRVSQILKNVENATWWHVSTSENPADLGTRGCQPQDLISKSLWWYGPKWLSNSPSNWPNCQPQNAEPPEQRRFKTFHLTQKEDVLDAFSSFGKALRVIAYVLRFIHKCQKRSQDTGPLSQYEINVAKTLLIIIAQKRFFLNEYSQLTRAQAIVTTSVIQSYCPETPDSANSTSNFFTPLFCMRRNP